MDWSRINGVVNGKEGSRFDPQGIASRAEVAMIRMNYLQTRQAQPGSGLAVAPSWTDGDMMATAAVTPHEQQTLYLWEESNAPAVTEYTVNNGNYSDDPSARSGPFPKRPA